MGFNYDNLLTLAGALSQMGAAMDPNPEGFARRMGGVSADAVQSEMMRRELDKQKKEQERQQRAQKFGQFGRVAGSIVGGPVGGAVGGIAGKAAGGGKFQSSDLVSAGTDLAFGAFAAPKLLGGGKPMPGGLGEGQKSLEQPIPGPAMNAMSEAKGQPIPGAAMNAMNGKLATRPASQGIGSMMGSAWKQMTTPMWQNAMGGQGGGGNDMLSTLMLMRAMGVM